MREILFRGKRIDNGEWVEGDLVRNKPTGCYRIFSNFANVKHGCFTESGLHECSGELYLVTPETVGQLRHKNKHGQYFDGDIYYCAGYGIDVVSEYCEITDRNMHGDIDDIGEIKGNVFDNPDLIL